MVQIKKQYVSQSVIDKRSYGKGNPVTSITVHQTGNTTKGANAQAHANLQSRLNPRQASWHIQVDEKQAIQSFPDDVRCWAATDGRKSDGGNMTSLHVELCINSDGDYKKTLENGAKVVAQKLKEHNLKITDVKQHRNWYNKNCPAQLRAGYKGISWDDFLKMVADKPTKKPAPKPASKPTSKPKKPKLVVDGYMGPLTIMALQVYFGTVVDGVLSKPSLVIKALQSFLNKHGAKLKVDGYFGPLTIRALQSYFGTPVDGKLSKPSLVIKALQRALNKGKL